MKQGTLHVEATVLTSTETYIPDRLLYLGHKLN